MRKSKNLITMMLVVVMMLAMGITASAEEVEKESNVFFTEPQMLSTNSVTTLSDLDFSVAENLHVLLADIPSGYTLKSAKSSSDDDENVDFYGVVRTMYHNDHSDVWVLDMKSNIVGLDSKIYQRSAYMTELRWDVDVEGEDAVTTDWAPAGTTTVQSDGFDLNLSINPSYKGISLGEIGATFKVNQKNDIIRGFANSDSYYARWNTNKALDTSHPQDLSAMVSYNTPNYTEWTWTWSWEYDYWFWN